ncbi:reverse transcriptase domain-containing protein [Bradyrhizobium sp. sGM-13]|uniref:reverse transcriptase domain-containing protein n=1 Tax=Bradyrhizobium sp. sGM-13 TaxID=2831781 RepID=UPI00211323BC|nr:reverse transcriptase domain-containing protein [Bradyrhizobium sp. sGM-13]
MPARGEAQRRDTQEVETIVATAEPKSPASTEHLMEAICDPGNIEAALDAVVRNKGAPGIDGITVKQLPDILQGRYQPQPVRRVRIPKPDGGTRNLDRVIQQAILLRLQPLWDPTFSEHSYGFRPGRSAHQAVAQAQAYIIEGYRFVVDIDLAKFLDVASYYTFSFFERVEEVRSNCRYLNSYAFCPSAIDVNGLKLAALYTLQDGLPRDAE